MKIGVVGLWHLGEVVSLGLAELGHTVTAFDSDAKRIGDFQNGTPAIEEPGVKELATKHAKNGRVSYEVFSPKRVAEYNVIFITFDTPITKKDEPDTKVIEETAVSIARYAKPGALIVFMSQMPVGTTRGIARKLKSKGIEIAYVPENLQLGKAMESFLKPARTIVGADSDRAKKAVLKIFEKLPGEKIIMSVPSAEMVKHALNSFLATSLSFIYNISDLCEAVGADVISVSRALKADPRIGQAAYLDTSLGFSGGTLMRDMRVLEKRAREYGLAIPVISGTIQTNGKRLMRALTLLRMHLGASLAGKRVTVLGLTYKPGTPTLRSSLAISLMKLLKEAGMNVAGSDPMAPCEEVKNLTGAACERDLYRAAEGSHAVIMITAWPEYAALDIKRLAGAMRAPRVFIDARNFLASRAKEFEKAKFRYQGVGRGSVDI